MAAIIRRIDDLGRIVIPRKIREEMGITEGMQFEIEKDSWDTITIKKVNNVHNIKSNVIWLRKYVRECEDISDSSANEIDSKLREIDKIINMEYYMNRVN